MKKLYFSLVAILFLAVANAQIVIIPDPVFKAALLNPNDTFASTQPADGTPSVYAPIDTNNDGEIQVSEAQLIKRLDLYYGGLSNISSLEGFESFSNLEGLFIDSLTYPNLDLSSFSQLKSFQCSFLNIVSMNLSNLTNLRYFYINSSSNNISLNFSGCTNLNQIVSPDAGVSNMNLTGCFNLITLDYPASFLNSLDLTDCFSLEDLKLYDCPNLESLDISHCPNLINLVMGTFDSLTFVNIKNGRSSTYFNDNPLCCWEPSAGRYLCLDEDAIEFAEQFYQDNGTFNYNSYCSFSPGGTFSTLQGTAKIDLNNNDCDTNDPIYPNLKLLFSNGTTNNDVFINNSTGNYSIPVSAGTHTITPQFENSSYFNASPASATVTFPSTTSPFTQDFCIVPNGVHHDIEVVVIPIIGARPGFDATYKIKYKNKGNQIENATLTFNYNDTILDFVSSSVATTSQTGETLSWNVENIAPFQSGEIVVTLNLNSPTETPAVNAGNILSYTATVNGLDTDDTPNDNAFSIKQIVVNSLDPNDKKCLEGETLSSSKIGEYVHYKIRFENTGTYPAQNIVVKDMIDTTKFDISTLQMTDASHSCVTKISNTNKVEFIFENINLPFDDATNDGYVVFKIKTKPTLVVGNTISNSANIYFDYNFPIVTNTATSTFQTLANNDFYLDKNVSLSPIPTKDILTISLQNTEKINSVSIYNMLGQVVQTVIGSNNIINVSELKTGDYIIKITTENGSISKKFIKE